MTLQTDLETALNVAEKILSESILGICLAQESDTKPLKQVSFSGTKLPHLPPCSALGQDSKEVTFAREASHL
jgi:hypothetical protein